MKVYIYILKDPITRKIRYVGKTIRPGLRKKEHLQRATSGCSFPIYRWIRKLQKCGVTPIFEIVDSVYPDDWEKTERFWIKHFREIGCDLLNCTDGGEGASGFIHSLESRKKMSLSAKGKIVTPETRKKMSIARRCEGNPNSKLTEKDVEEILKLWMSRECTQTEMATRFNVSVSRINGICRGRRWENVQRRLNYNPNLYIGMGEDHPESKLSNDDVKKIVFLWRQGQHTKKEIADMFGVVNTTICRILNGKSRKLILDKIGYVPIRRIKRGPSLLKEQDVEQILELWTTGKYTQVALGEMFGVCGHAIGSIVRCENWADIAERSGYKPTKIKKTRTTIGQAQEKQIEKMLIRKMSQRDIAKSLGTTRWHVRNVATRIKDGSCY